MSPSRPAMLRRSSPLSRQRGLDSGCGAASHNSGGNGPRGKTHNTTRSASRGNRVSTKPGAVHDLYHADLTITWHPPDPSGRIGGDIHPATKPT
jgi:hypothetical protein